MRVSHVSQTEQQPRLGAVRQLPRWLGAALGVMIAMVAVHAFAADSDEQRHQQMRAIFGLSEKSSESATPELTSAFEAFIGGDVEKAFSQLKLANKKDETLPPDRVLLARLFFAANRTDFARMHLEQAAVEHPESPEVYLLFGNLALAEGRLNDAKLNYTKALDAVNVRGGAEGMTEAKRMLLSQIYAGLTTVEERRNNWEPAAYFAMMWKEIATDAEKPQAQMRLARATYFNDKTDRREEATKELAEAIKLDKAEADKRTENKGKPDFPNMKVLLAQWETQKGGKDSVDAAEKYLNEALKEAPNDADVHAFASRWYLEHDRAVEAQDHALKAKALDPDSDAVTLLGAIVSLHRKKYEDAEEKFRQLYLKTPSDFTISNYLALALAGSGNKDKLAQAQGFAEVNARSYQQSPQALSTLAWVYFNQGMLAESENRKQDAERLFTDAEKLLTSAVSGQQAQPDTVYYLARVLAKRGRLNEAVQLLDKVADVNGPFLYRAEAKDWRDHLHGVTRLPSDDSDKKTGDGLTTSPTP